MQWRHTVWPEAKLIYTAVAKVANTSVKSALLRTFVDPSLKGANPHSEDMPYITVPPGRVDSEYPDFLHFALVRNPFARMVSFWADKIDGDGMTGGLERLGFKTGMPFDQAVNLACSLSDEETDPHIRSQSYLLANEKGRLRPDLVLRFERLDQDWDALRALVRYRTAAELPSLPKRRVSEHSRSRDYYDDATLEAVAQRYALDFELCGYDPTQPAIKHKRRPDGVTDALVRMGGSTEPRNVLDLSGALITRAEAVEPTGGIYLGSFPRNGLGQIARPSAVSRGRVAERLFDVVVVDTTRDSTRDVVDYLIGERSEEARVVLDKEGEMLVGAMR